MLMVVGFGGGAVEPGVVVVARQRRGAGQPPDNSKTRAKSQLVQVDAFKIVILNPRSRRQHDIVTQCMGNVEVGLIVSRSARAIDGGLIDRRCSAKPCLRGGGRPPYDIALETNRIDRIER